jgi:hypothetical protein
MYQMNISISIPKEIRKMKINHAVFALVFCLVADYTSAQQNHQKLEASIERAIAGSLQEITYTYTVGDEKITRGGGIRFEYPVAYAETEFLFWSRPQTEEPELLGHVSAKASTGAELAVVTYGIAGGIFQCTLKDGELKKGDELNIRYKGLAQSLARDFIVRAETRESQNDSWQKVSNPPIIKILPHTGNTLILTSPADLSIGETFDLAVVILDKFGNLASDYRGSIIFQSSDKNALLPKPYSFTESDGGIHVFQKVAYNSPGFQKIEVETADNLETSTHYSYISQTETEFKRYFGDTHFHTGTGTLNTGFFGIEPGTDDDQNRDVNMLSLEDFQKLNSGGDHRGNFTTQQEAYAYAKDVTRLDFASASEHDVSLFDQKAWDLSQSLADAFYQPGKFTTFFAYEWTPGIMHHIILYKEKGLSVFDHRAHPDLPSLWTAFDKQGKPVLCIPHVTWNFEDHTIWDHINNTYRRLGEIYSLWNGRFLIQPGDEPQRFELGKDNKWSYQYAWHKGHKIGVIGSTDNHLSQPGVNNYTIYTQHAGGLAVTLSKENNRDQLWEALENRRTYATTGTRIYLDFTINGHPMGSEITSENVPVIAAKVGGTNKLEAVQVVKYSNGEYSIIYNNAPDSEIAEYQFEDQDFDSDSFYYLRVTQVSEVPGRLWTYPTNDMAWSSPIWVEFEK